MKYDDIPFEMTQPPRNTIQCIEIQDLMIGAAPIQGVQMPADGEPQFSRSRMPVQDKDPFRL